MSQSTPYIVVHVSCGNGQQAQDIAQAVIAERLTACVQTLPIQSIYSWQGEVEEEGEYLLMMKTRIELYERLQSLIVELHDYDVPQIIALPILQGLPEYLQWIDDSVDQKTG